MHTRRSGQLGRGGSGCIEEESTPVNERAGGGCVYRGVVGMSTQEWWVCSHWSGGCAYRGVVGVSTQEWWVCLHRSDWGHSGPQEKTKVEPAQSGEIVCSMLVCSLQKSCLMWWSS